MLEVEKFVVNPFGENTYLVFDRRSRECIIVDPGMFNAEERALIDSFIRDNGLKLVQIVNTHLHLDHCFGINNAKADYGIKLAAHPGDAFLGESFVEQLGRFGFNVKGPEAPQILIDVQLSDGDAIKIGDNELRVISVPGHSPGGIALYDAADGFVITGDSLFRGSIGRTDLAGGDMNTLIDSVTDKLLSLPDDTVVMPGHGPYSTIGEEKHSNPFLC
jgi:glyoxylase-like metal-dependent hydrolase (beta-lactamase superfamily II)